MAPVMTAAVTRTILRTPAGFIRSVFPVRSPVVRVGRPRYRPGLWPSRCRQLQTPQEQIPPSRQSSTSTSAVGAAEEPTQPPDSESTTQDSRPRQRRPASHPEVKCASQATDHPGQDQELIVYRVPRSPIQPM
jgi:hypothetical protein